MTKTNKDAVAVAAKQSGLRPDQVECAVDLYRKAATDLIDEPDWKAVSHMSGSNFGAATYGAVGTKVTLLVESWKESRKEGGGWAEAWSFHYRGEAYEHWSEARAAELAEEAKYRPHSIS